MIESLPPKQRAIWVCDDLIQRLSDCNDAKFPGLSEMRIQELNCALRQLGIVIEPIKLRRIEQIGQEVEWIDPDGLSKGTMRFNILVLRAVGEVPIEQAKWVEARGGIDIQSSRLKLIAILRAWSRVISTYPENPEKYALQTIDNQNKPMELTKDQELALNVLKLSQTDPNLTWPVTFKRVGWLPGAGHGDTGNQKKRVDRVLKQIDPTLELPSKKGKK